MNKTVEISAYTIVIIDQLRAFLKQTDGIDVTDTEVIQMAINIMKLYYLIRQNHMMGKMIEEVFAEALQQHNTGFVK